MKPDKALTIPGLIFNVMDEHVMCCNYHVNLMNAEYDTVIMTDLTEEQIRALQVLVHRKTLLHTEIYLVEEADFERQELHFREDGRLVEDFLSHIFTMNADLVMDLMG